MSTTIYGVIILICFFHAYECEPRSGWHECNNKCYHFGENTITYGIQTTYCYSVNGSVPVDFGSMTAGTIATIFLQCRISKADNVPYWINKQNVQNPTCRTVIFDGVNVGMNPTEDCSSFMYPICEKEASFCKASDGSQAIKHSWVRVAGQGPYFMLSSDSYPFCEAKGFCESWNGQISRGGNYSLMGQLGLELGIAGTTMVEFWLDSQDVSCPAELSYGKVMQYVGPLVQAATNKSTKLEFSVLCTSYNPHKEPLTQTNTPVSSTSTQVPTNSPQETGANGSNRNWQSCADKCFFLSPGQSTYADLASFCHSIRESKPVDFGLMQKEDIKTKLSLCAFDQLEQTPYWINQENGAGKCRSIKIFGGNLQVDQQVPCNSLMHPFCETDKPLCHSNVNLTILAVKRPSQTSSPLGISSQIATLSQLASQTIPTLKTPLPNTAGRQSQPQTTTGRQSQQQTTTGRQSQPQTSTRRQSPSQTTTRRQPTSHTTTRRQSPSQTTTRRQPPSQTTTRRQPTSQTLAVSKVSGEPVWLKVGEKQYYVNYNCDEYIQKRMINHFRIFAHPVSETDSWTGAKITTDEELDETDFDLIPYVNKPVHFQTSKEKVQEMWQLLRQQRNPT